MFALDALPAWDPLLPKEAIVFQAEQPRRVRLAFNVNGPFEVWATYQVNPYTQDVDGNLYEKPDPETRDVLLASGDRTMEEVTFTTWGETVVRVLADDDTVIFVRHFTADHRVAASDDASYTTPFPRERRNTEFDRMVMWAKLNEKRREAQFQEALAALAQSTPQVVQNTATATAEPEPEQQAGGGE